MLGNQQVTYSAPDIINHPQLGFSGVVKCGDEYQFHSFSSFADELLHLAASPNQSKLAAVLILPPDKTMLLLIGSSNESALFESHSHLGRGGIIAAAGPGKLKEMAFYIDYMARRDWSCNPTPFVTFVTLLRGVMVSFLFSRMYNFKRSLFSVMFILIIIMKIMLLFFLIIKINITEKFLYIHPLSLSLHSLLPYSSLISPLPFPFDMYNL